MTEVGYLDQDGTWHKLRDYQDTADSKDQKELTHYMSNLLQAGMSVAAVLEHSLPIAEDLIIERIVECPLSRDKRSEIAIAASDLLLTVAKELGISQEKNIK